ncbi:uncharacterized protein LOC128147339 [Harpia harpyja]|uniref:uncharacterized protein LOC128147339 n=2 Tax=Harpia harpyja TaxID=202280 RepID=UPI0022B1B5CF|nr:uncharacterized protein LOC128147339 [Harpia harpyja]
MSNSSSITQFLLLAFADTRELQLLHFGLFLGIYLAALLGNGLIIIAVACDQHLHTPMYFFLLNLSLLDLGSISTTLPKSMANALLDTRAISYAGCSAQVFLFVFVMSSEFSLLTVMAYDRFITICKPLHYGTLLGSRACANMAAAAWGSGFLYAMLHTANTFSLLLCQGNAVNQFFCEIPQILKLSCSDSYLREVGLLVVSALVFWGCFVFIVLSYVQIFRAVLRIPSEQGRHKAFSTCLPHLAVVSLFLSTGMFAYLKPPSISSPSLDLVMADLYSVVPPAVNPLIYSMRNRELKDAIRKLISSTPLSRHERLHPQKDVGQDSAWLQEQKPVSHAVTHDIILEGNWSCLESLRDLQGQCMPPVGRAKDRSGGCCKPTESKADEDFVCNGLRRSFSHVPKITAYKKDFTDPPPPLYLQAMGNNNQTLATDFIFLGFSSLAELQKLLLVVFLLLYLVTLSMNTTIMIIIWADRSLHTPMYFFLCVLSFSETCYTFVIVPKMLVDLIAERKTISFLGCAVQMYFFLFLGCSHSFLLAAMGYDRCVAICHPLHYNRIMTWRVCAQLVVASALSGFLVAQVVTPLIFCLPFHTSRKLNHFFCDISPVLRVAFTHTNLSEAIIFTLGISVLTIPLMLILISYLFVVLAILQIPSAAGRHKAFSTCSAHLIVVIVHYGCASFIYLRPDSSYSSDQDALISVTYTILTPLLNPMIYSLRNKDVKMALQKAIRKNILSQKVFQ